MLLIDLSLLTNVIDSALSLYLWLCSHGWWTVLGLSLLFPLLMWGKMVEK